MLRDVPNVERLATACSSVAANGVERQRERCWQACVWRKKGTLARKGRFIRLILDQKECGLVYFPETAKSFQDVKRETVAWLATSSAAAIDGYNVAVVLAEATQACSRMLSWDVSDDAERRWNQAKAKWIELLERIGAPSEITGAVRALE